VRAGERLLEELTKVTEVLPVIWRNGGWEALPKRGGGVFSDLARHWRSRTRIVPEAGDTLLTTELFSEDERPGIRDFLRSKSCRTVAVFHDAIPLRMPEICRAKSVARHADYMLLLAECSQVLAVSQVSKRELESYWVWAGRKGPPVATLTWGADFSGAPRETDTGAALPAPALLCVGIIEPRKNQGMLLDACAELWESGLNFTLNIAGRVNEETGAALQAKLRAGRRKYPSLRLLQGTGDAALAALYRQSRALAFPTLAEGFGLPLVEALWAGVPCVCSNLPVLREQAEGGGCVLVAPDDLPAWVFALRKILTDDGHALQLRNEARQRRLPTWRDAATQVMERLKIKN